MLVPNSFELKKLKLMKGGGIEIKYTLNDKDDHATHQEENLKKSTKEPHPDMKDALKELREFVASTHNMMPHKALSHLKATAKVEESIKNLSAVFAEVENETLEKIKISGISLSGDENNRGVVIMAVNEFNKEKIALNTPLIRLAGDKWGWEVKLNDIVDSLINEASEFIFNGKAEQLEMDFGSEDEKEKEPEAKSA